MTNLTRLIPSWNPHSPDLSTNSLLKNEFQAIQATHLFQSTIPFLTAPQSGATHLEVQFRFFANELWYSPDGQNWQTFPRDPQNTQDLLEIGARCSRMLEIARDVHAQAPSLFTPTLTNQHPVGAALPNAHVIDARDARIQDLEEQLHVSELAREQQIQTNEALRNHIASLEADRDHAYTRVKTLTLQLQDSQGRINHLERELITLYREQDETTSEITALNDHFNRTLDQHKQALTDLRDALDDQGNNAEAALETAQAQIAALTAELQQSTTGHEALRRQLASLQSELQEATQARDAAATQVTALQAELGSTGRRNQQEIVSLRADLQTQLSEKHRAETSLAELTNSFNATNDQLTAQIQAAQSLRNELQQATEARSRAETQIAALQAELQAKQARIATLTAELHQSTTGRTASQEQLASLQSQLRDAMDRITTLSASETALQGQRSALQSELQQATQARDAAAAQAAALQAQLASTGPRNQQEIVRLQAELQAANQAKDQTAATMRALEQNITDLRAEKQTLASQHAQAIRTLENEIARLRTQLGTASAEELTALQHQLATTQAELAEQLSTNETLRLSYTDLTSKLLEYENANAQLQEKIQHLEHQLYAANYDLEMLHSQLKTLLGSRKTTTLEIVSEIAQALRKAAHENQRLRQQLEALFQENTRLLEEPAFLAQQIHALQAELSRYETLQDNAEAFQRALQNQAALQEELQSSKALLAAVQGQLDTKTQAHAQMQAELAAIRKEQQASAQIIKRLEAQNRDLQNQVTQKQTEWERQADQINTLIAQLSENPYLPELISRNSQISALEQELAHLRATIHDLETESEQFQSTDRAKNRTIQELEAMLQVQRTEHAALLLSLKTRESNLRALTAELAESRAANISLADRASTLQSALEESMSAQRRLELSISEITNRTLTPPALSPAASVDSGESEEWVTLEPTEVHELREALAPADESLSPSSTLKLNLTNLQIFELYKSFLTGEINCTHDRGTTTFTISGQTIVITSRDSTAERNRKLGSGLLGKYLNEIHSTLSQISQDPSKNIALQGSIDSFKKNCKKITQKLRNNRRGHPIKRLIEASKDYGGAAIARDLFLFRMIPAVQGLKGIDQTLTNLFAETTAESISEESPYK